MCFILNLIAYAVLVVVTLHEYTVSTLFM